MRILLLTFILALSLNAQENIFIKYYEDTSNRLSIDEITTDRLIEFQEAQSFNFGSKKTAFWLQLIFQNDKDQDQSRIFQFRDSRLDDVQIFKNNIQINHIGDNFPFINRSFKDSSPSFKISAKAHSSSTYYIRIKTIGTMNLRYTLFKNSEYKKYLNIKEHFYLFYFGATVIMLLYNFILFIFIRERAFFDYVIYHLLLLLVFFYYSGFYMRYFSPQLYNINGGNVPTYLVGLTLIMATQFMRSYLRTKELLVKVDIFVFYFIAMDILSILLSTISSAYYFNHIFISILMIAQSLFLVFISLYLIVYKKSNPAKFYFTGWSVMLFAVVLIGFMNIGIVPRNTFTNYTFQVASLLELLLLSMGLAYRYNEQQKLIFSQDQELKLINQNLTLTIHQRTNELNIEVQNTKALLQEREILFKELYHRVKNNLQMLTSIISMQKRRLPDEASKLALKDVEGRIKSLALLHEQLQTTQNLEKIDMQNYFSILLQEVKNSYALDTLEIETRCENILMNISQVTSLGLIINELSNNSFKHAFKNQENPKITLHIKENQDQYHLLYTDNGIGDDKIKTSKSLGSTLIQTLTKSQLKGDIVLTTDPSISYTITFPKNLKEF